MPDGKANANKATVKLIQAKATAFKTTEDIWKKQRERGTLVKIDSVYSSMWRFGEKVRTKAGQIAEGISIEVSGKSLVEVERIVSDRIQAYLRDSGDCYRDGFGIV